MARVIRGWSAGIEDPCVLTIGSFDGFHRGHRALIQKAKEWAGEKGIAVMIVTFSPHPAQVVGRSVPLIQAQPQRTVWLETAPSDFVWEIPFTPAIANMEAESFLEQVLLAQVSVQGVVVGEDFRFGYGRRGDVTLLNHYSIAWRYDVEVVPGITIEGIPCRSSRIRDQIRTGQVQGVIPFLGRPFALWGIVHPGERIGANLGFPTANLWWWNMLLPASGVYLTTANLSGSMRPGVTNIGVRPTFGGRRLRVETYFPDIDVNLYGQTLELFFLERLRDEKTYASIEQLKSQVRNDVDRALEIYKNRYSAWAEAGVYQPWNEATPL